MIKIFRNPFYTYIASFVMVLVLYSFGWTGINPPLSTSLLVFFLMTFIIAYVQGYMFDKVNLIEYKNISMNKTKTLLIVLVLIYVFYIIEIIINNGFPLWSLLHRNNNVHYKLFGIKYLHLFTVTVNSFFIIYSFHCYLSNRSAKLFYLYILAYIPAFFIVNRGIIIIGVLSSFFVFIQCFKGKLKPIQISFLVIISVVTMYVFGYLGNIRTESYDSSKITIYEGSKADRLFMDSVIPKEFYWTYLYTTSPLAIFQNTINETKEIENNFFLMIINECLPDVVSKRVNNVINFNRPKSKLVVNWLTADTVYSKSYVYTGWIGPTFIYLFMSVFIHVIIKIFPKENEFHVSTVAILMTLIFLNIFDNMFVFSGISLMFMYPIIMTLGTKIFKKIRLLLTKSLISS